MASPASDIWSEDMVKENQFLELADTHPALYRYIEGVEGVASRSAKWYLIFMAVRLVEMHRVLKSTGSIYLHCDPTASHYLKPLMDGIWGHAKGGTDHPDNLRLLCPHCNSIKGNRPMEYLQNSALKRGLLLSTWASCWQAIMVIWPRQQAFTGIPKLWRGCVSNWPRLAVM